MGPLAVLSETCTTTCGVSQKFEPENSTLRSSQLSKLARSGHKATRRGSVQEARERPSTRAGIAEPGLPG